MNDESLMKSYVAGDEEAFNKLYQKYSSMVFAYARKRLPADEAEDFFQKVWRHLHEKRDRYQGQPFAPWFFVLIRHLLIDEYRSRARMAVEVKDELLEKIYAQNNLDQDLEELLSNLTPVSAELVRKYYLEGVSYEELEKETGLSQTGLRQRLSRTLKGLRQKVQGDL